ncbi:Glycosyltransferase involved in cell wall bisynthesis [Ruminococcaceae bacterium YAD3003]|nr:Glycosyltransferase involved in cell wall bisynthesis [Ruminococcaceae bacterium YAD3003]
MKILHIAYLEDNPYSGVCVVVPQHIKAHQELGHEVAFLNIFGGRKVEGIDCQISNIEDFPNPDIVVFHECYRKAYLKLGKRFVSEGIPYIVIPHGELSNDAQKKKHLKKVTANILLFNKFTNNALAVQCLSQREFDNTNFGKKKIIATNGVAIPDERKENFNQYKTRIVYIGRLDSFHKGLDLMIDAARIAHDKMIATDTTIDIYGPDIHGEYAHVEELIKMAGVSDVVNLHGAVTGDKKRAILLDADLFIQTSRFEGMPLAILEALSCGLPCLVTRGTTLGERIEEAKCGIMAETDSESIAQKLIQIIDERSSFKEMSDNAVRFVDKNFSWNSVAKDTIRQYTELLRQCK